MDIIEAVRSRKSIRGYKPDPVPKEVLREILEVASRSPSAMNTQPWEITVITGQVLEDIKRGAIEMLDSGVTPERDVPSQRYEGNYKQRQVELAIALFKLLGIAREDKEKRAKLTRKGYRFFDAPAAIIVSTDRSLVGSAFALLDLGAIIQTICLVAMKYGLGTCILGQGVTYSKVVRRFTGIPDSKRMVMSIAIGYPDWDFPANALETRRESVENFVTWCGWE